MKPVAAAFIICLALCLTAYSEEDHSGDTTHAAVTDTTKAETERTPDTTTNTLTEPSEKPMVFTLYKINDGKCPDCRWIGAEGNIVPDTPATFSRFIDDNKLDDAIADLDDLLIAFHSDGGDILAAISLGREIRKHRFNTTIGGTIEKPVDKPANDQDAKKDEQSEESPAASGDNKTIPQRVEGVCREACVWAFLGGRARNVADGKLELRTYRPPLDGAGTASGQEVSVRKQQLADIAYIADYSQEMGFNPLIAFLNWDNANSHIFSADEIESYKINFSPDIIGKWQLAPTGKSLAAIATSNDNKTSARLYCDSHKTMYLELSAPTRYSAESYQNFQQTVTTLNIWGMPAGINQLQTNLSEGRVVHTIELPKNPLQDWHVDAPYLKGENVPEALSGVLNIRFSDMAGLKQAASFVIANCPTASH